MLFVDGVVLCWGFLEKRAYGGYKMDIIEFADVIDKQIIITYYPNQNERYSAQFDDCEVKKDCILESTHGNGSTPMEATNDYANQISNQKIVFNAYSQEYRQEYRVPQLEEIK